MKNILVGQAYSRSNLGLKVADGKTPHPNAIIKGVPRKTMKFTKKTVLERLFYT